MIYAFKALKITWKQQRLWLILSLINSLVLGLIPITTVWVLQKVINSVVLLIQTSSTDYIIPLTWLIIQFLLTLANSVLQEFQLYIDRKAEEKLEISLQEQVLKKVVSVSAFYFDVPDFYNRLDRVKGNLGGRFLNPIRGMIVILKEAITVVTIFSYLFSIHWSLSTLSLLAAIPILIIQRKMGLKQYFLVFHNTPLSREIQYIQFMLRDRSTSKEIRLFKLGEYFITKWKTKSNELLNKTLKLLRKAQIYAVGGEGISAFFYLLAALIIILLIQNHSLTIGEFVAVGQAVQNTQSSINSIAKRFGAFKEEIFYIKDYFELVDYYHENDNNVQGIESFPKTLKLGITLKDVSFNYINSDKEVLKNISLHVNPGEKIAIVGENGSGKTTFVKCLSGLYPLAKGQIFFDNIEIKSIKEHELFNNITVVFQDFIKYPYTIKENIHLGNISRSENLNSIVEVSKKAGVHDFVTKFEKGYETYLGRILEDGEDISGGQWQRIALARSLFKNGEIFILDEPTAALDPIAELEVFEKFDLLTKNKTTFFISHRMASAKIADRILVFKEGEIVETGSHEELMRLKGEYYSLFNMQAKWYNSDYNEEGKIESVIY
ncbi:ABC transporter ATP-binding protein [Lysinibacillus boronitolerans]|uniref:ABC transporter ATP-binding protein n=1 Tax=Lysinibacillus boronitolerans TaxID=309788 RepID=UPI003852D103